MVDELNRKFTKGTWTKAEDQQLMEIVRQMGPKRWSTIAEKLEGRIGKQCRERWYNHLDPNVKKEWWSPEEDYTIIEHHERHGNQWSQIAKRLSGRPANAIKNHWNSTLKRVVKRAKIGLANSGIHPVLLPPCPKRKKNSEHSGATIKVFLNINTPLEPSPFIPKAKKNTTSTITKKYKKRTASQRKSMDPTPEEFHSPARKKLKRGRGRPSKKRDETLIARLPTNLNAPHPYPIEQPQTVIPKHQNFAHLNFASNIPTKGGILVAHGKPQQPPPFGVSPNKNADPYMDMAIFDENHYVNPSSSSQNFPTISDMSALSNVPSSNSQNGWGPLNAHAKAFSQNSMVGSTHSSHFESVNPLDSDVLTYDENSLNQYSFTASGIDHHNLFASPEKSQQGWEHHDTNSNSNLNMHIPFLP